MWLCTVLILLLVSLQSLENGGRIGEKTLCMLRLSDITCVCVCVCVCVHVCEIERGREREREGGKDGERERERERLRAREIA